MGTLRREPRRFFSCSVALFALAHFAGCQETARWVAQRPIIQERFERRRAIQAGARPNLYVSGYAGYNYTPLLEPLPPRVPPPRRQPARSYLDEPAE